MRENLNTFNSHPYIVSCSQENKGTTDASLTYHQVLKSIILIRRHPEINKTLVQIHEDKKPFDKKQEIVLDFETYHAVVSIDRRNSEEQVLNRFVIVALVKDDARTHILARLPFPGTSCN